MDFSISNLLVIHVAGVEIWITETIVNTWIIMLLLIAAAIVVRIKLRKFREVPTGFQNAVEAIVETFDKFVKNTAGDKLQFLGSWFFMVFAFVLVSNVSGILGLRPPTADWATALALAMATFMLIHIVGVMHRKGRYLKSFIEPNIIFLPLNIIGELARPVSLSFRLFGNVLAGVILMSMVYKLLPVYLRVALPTVLHAYFDLISGVLQTYIFCVLSLSFIHAASSAEAP